jgi:type I restriction enzyme S subunit
MEVNPNDNPADVGPIPEDWTLTSVQELVKEGIIEKPLDGNHGNIHPKSSDYVDNGIPFVMANNFVNGQIDVSSCKFLTKERADKLQKGFSISGDVLLTHKGTVGNTAIVGELSTEYIMLTPQVTYYRVIDGNRMSNRFLRHYFDSQPFQSLFSNLAGGGTRAYLGIVRQLALPILQPPIEEQYAIATKLSDVDTLLNALGRLITKKRDLKQAAMQQLLTGQTRLPGFRGKWEVKRLEEIAQLRKMRIDPRRTEVQEFCVELEHIEQGTGHLIGHGFAGAGSSLKTIFEKDDVLFGKLRAYLKKYWLATCGGVCSTEVWALEAKPSLLVSQFLFQIVKTDGFVDAASSAYGTHMPRSDWNVIKNYKVHLPSIDEQTAIGALLLDMDAELAALDHRVAKTRALKQAMMQELLTGKTRLVPPTSADA